MKCHRQSLVPFALVDEAILFLGVFVDLLPGRRCLGHLVGPVVDEARVGVVGQRPFLAFVLDRFHGRGDELVFVLVHDRREDRRAEPAAAYSAVQITSISSTSHSLDSARRRCTCCSRCRSADSGSSSRSAFSLGFSLLKSFDAAVKAPLVSLPMHQVTSPEAPLSLCGLERFRLRPCTASAVVVIVSTRGKPKRRQARRQRDQISHHGLSPLAAPDRQAVRARLGYPACGLANRLGWNWGIQGEAELGRGRPQFGSPAPGRG